MHRKWRSRALRAAGKGGPPGSSPRRLHGQAEGPDQRPLRSHRRRGLRPERSQRRPQPSAAGPCLRVPAVPEAIRPVGLPRSGEAGRALPRRGDTEGQAGRLFKDLIRHFGNNAVFMDVAGIEPGRDFRKAIDDQVSSCSVLLAVIGKGWVIAKDHSGTLRLDDPMDFFRLETASALSRDIPVEPLLVQGAEMPRAEELPEDLRVLSFATQSN